MTAELHEIEGAPRIEDAKRRILSGEVFVARGCLQALGLLDDMRAASLEGVRRSAGDEVAARVAERGFEALHEIVEPAAIPGISGAVLDVVSERGPRWIARVVHQVLGAERPFYFERVPNVRFLIPYDLAVKEREAFRRYAGDHGDGKVTPHGPHRDSWLDCPLNAVNVWIAVGPVRPGNGLTLFPGSYGTDLAHTPRGDLAPDRAPGHPTNFSLEPGDAVIFHGDQLHASEINQTGATRHVVSFRLTLDRPQYRAGHYHHYVHSGWHESALRPLAGLPANLTWPWLRTRLGWVVRDARALLGGGVVSKGAAPHGDVPEPQADGAEVRFPASELPAGALRALSPKVCAARLADGRVLAFSRRCPHEGADLALGEVNGDHVSCPWHGLDIDPATGQSPCKALRALRSYPVRQDGEQIVVTLRGESAPPTAH